MWINDVYIVDHMDLISTHEVDEKILERFDEFIKKQKFKIILNPDES